MKPPLVVWDASVVVAALGWRREAHRCLVLLARRWLFAVGTTDTLTECGRTLERLAASHSHFGRTNWRAGWQWLQDRTRIVVPAPLGKRRSRDPQDDPYLAAALGAGAAFVLTRDPDLLALGKPFGVEMIEPRAFLARLLR